MLVSSFSFDSSCFSAAVQGHQMHFCVRRVDGGTCSLKATDNRTRWILCAGLPTHSVSYTAIHSIKRILYKVWSPHFEAVKRLHGEWNYARRMNPPARCFRITTSATGVLFVGRRRFHGGHRRWMLDRRLIGSSPGCSGASARIRSAEKPMLSHYAAIAANANHFEGGLRRLIGRSKKGKHFM